MLRLAPHACSTPSCTREATITITDRGKLVGRHCAECFAVIDLILETTSRIARTGVPREIAADWAARAVHEIA